MVTIHELVTAAFQDGVIAGIKAAQGESEVNSVQARTTDIKELFHDFAVSMEPGIRSLARLLRNYIESNEDVIPVPEALLVDLDAFTKKAGK